MVVDDSVEALRAFARRQGIEIEAIEPAALGDLMAGWYESERADGIASIESDGDGLLFEWGTYGFNSAEPTFQYGVTRQFTDRGLDADMWQLRVVLHFDRDADTDHAEHGTHWCFSPNDLPVFREAVATSPATPLVAGRATSMVEVYLDQV